MDIQRRNFLKGKFGSFASADELIIRLPWLSQPSNFTHDCTACGRCLDACPEGIIALDTKGYPRINFNAGECTFCGKCATACPEHLFDQDPAADGAAAKSPWNYRATISSDCLAKQKISCQSCRDCCEPAAITFTLNLGGPATPHLFQEDCTGCGACVSVCPSQAIAIIDASESTPEPSEIAANQR